MPSLSTSERSAAARRELVELLGAGSVGGALDERLLARDASICHGVAASLVCRPRRTSDVVEIMGIAARHALSVVTRGAGTGLAGGAVPVDESIVVVTTQMNRIVSIEAEDRLAWVEPGVLNLDLNRALEPLGFHFAPDPSSQQACTIGGNVANNSGGPHCLSEGVTTAHVAALEVVLPTGEVVMLGGADAEPDGLDLRGAFIGSEGTMGIATRIAVRLTPNPTSVTTLLGIFDELDAAADAVSGIINAGLLPAALEMIDGPLAAVLEDYVSAGLPRDAAAVLLVELDGSVISVADDTGRVIEVLTAGGAREVRVAQDDTQRQLWWKARKSAFGAIARIRPDYYLHDTVVPRASLTRVLREIRQRVEELGLEVYNVFHAGDGNLHPLVLFDAREPGVMERVHEAGRAIVRISLAAGGVLSGEHGIGIEKRDHMGEMFEPEDLLAQDRLRHAFDPDRRANPDKVIPIGAGCGDHRQLAALPEGVWI